MTTTRIVTLASLGLLAIFASVFAVQGSDEAGLRALVRSTARVSFLVFLLPYSASAVRRLFPSPATRWLLRRRRALGLCFAVAHGLHLVAVGMLSLLLGDAFETPLLTLVGGGLAYALLLAMALTSNDRAVARLGARRWNALHRAGLHWIWLVFAFDWVGHALASPGYLPLAALSLGALGLRVAARRARASRTDAVAPSAA